MIEFDQRISELVSQFKGLYRRYSDDFIIVIPGGDNDAELARLVLNKAIDLSESMLGLEIEKSKTGLYFYDGGKLIDQESGYPSKVDYLGFKFTGEAVYFREKSIYKFAYKSNRGVNFVIRDYGDKSLAQLTDNEISRKRFKRPKKFDKLGKAIAWEDAPEYHNLIRRKQIKLVKAKLANGVRFRISERNTLRYLSGNLKKRTFMNYASRAQTILEAGKPSYKVIVLKQARRRVRKNQARYHEGTSGVEKR
jgi:hypothetical protein